MKNLILGIFAGVLLLAVAVVWLVPPLTYDVLPFLWAGHHKQAITERANLLMDHLAKDDIDAAIQMADPAAIQKEGTKAIGVKARFMSGFVRLFGRSNLRVEEVILGDDSKTARVKLSRRQGDSWAPVDYVPSWVRVDGVWYLTF